MKVILSRKGFDLGNGDCASPILPDGTLLSMPIPSFDNTSYQSLNIDIEGFGNKTYANVARELNPRRLFDLCHLDPDIRRDACERPADWKPAFGQAYGSLTHLKNNDIKEGDLFLFFGWFRQTELFEGKLRFVKKAPSLHVIYGYLQIGEIINNPNEKNIPDWLKIHPHFTKKYSDNNAIFIARDNLTWDKSKEGAGCLTLDKKLVLTKEGHSRSHWDLPEEFKNISITNHSAKSWKSDYFKSVDIGQEFVFEESPIVEEWAKNIID